MLVTLALALLAQPAAAGEHTLALPTFAGPLTPAPSGPYLQVGEDIGHVRWDGTALTLTYLPPTLGRYCSASANWAAPVRSAMRRASLSTRWYARAESCSWAIAVFIKARPVASNLQC